jgi:uncharacterized protein (TIGR03435 family)
MSEMFGLRKNLFVSATSFAALVVTIVLSMILSSPTRAQSASAKPQFEVASVKPNTDDGRMISIPVRSGDHVLMHNNQVGSMILYAYHVSNYQIIGDTRLSEHWNWYDVDAKVEGSPTDEEIRLMFQSLLEDRFKLKVHHETREMEVYKLAVAKNGPKLNSATKDQDYKTTIDDRSITVRKGTVGISMWKEGAHLIGKSVTMAQLASALIGNMAGPVVDATSIEGTFDFDVLFAPANWPPDAEFNPPTLFAALKDALSLALEKGKSQVDVLVVDHLEKPTPN